MNVPFVDLTIQYHGLKEKIDEAIFKVINENAFIKGKYVKALETSFSEKLGQKECIGVANGTDAIYIVLKSLGIGQGDEVITTACSWIATSETISQTGATPVFVDIDPDFFTIDPNLIEAKITPKTKAIIPVHFFGQSCDMEKIVRICKKHNVFLIEDCAQAHFAKFRNQHVGTFGIASTFSFYPGKNLGAYGDAGAITTNDETLAKKCRMFANHGALVKHQHEIEGINSRLDGLQAAVLSVKLPFIDKWNDERYANALLYNKYLKEIPEVITPFIRKEGKHIFHVYCIRVKHRENLIKYLQNHNIETAIHYPHALPFLPAYDRFNHVPEDFPIAFNYQSQILSLPMFPELSREQIQFVCTKITEFFRK